MFQIHPTTRSVATSTLSVAPAANSASEAVAP